MSTVHATKRCKPGDLAAIVCNPELPDNIGGLVLVVRPCPFNDAYWDCEALCSLLARQGEGGRVARVPPGFHARVRDAYLRPLRDRPGDDEMVRLVGAPHELTLEEKLAELERALDRLLNRERA